MYRPARRHSGARSGCVGDRRRSELRSRRQDAAQRRMGFAGRRGSAPTEGHQRRRGPGRLRHRAAAAVGGGAHRGSGLPVQRPYRLVGHGRRSAGALPLQRTRSPSGLCRQLLRHQGIPDGELCPLHTHFRHAWQRRHVARQAGDDVPHGRLHDGHQEGDDHQTGCRSRGQELESFCAASDDRRRQDRRTGRAHQRRRTLQRTGVQRPGKGHSIPPQPPHGRDHPGAAVLGQGGWYSGELFAEVRSPDGYADGEPLAERQRRRSHGNDLHPGPQGDRHWCGRPRGEPAVPQHVLPGVERARLRVERLGAARTPRPGRQRHHCRHADRRQPRGDAAESRLRQHVPFSGRAGHARFLHRHASGPPDVPVPGIHWHSPWQRFLPALDRGQPGWQTVLQRTACHQKAGRRRLSCGTRQGPAEAGTPTRAAGLAQCERREHPRDLCRAQQHSRRPGDERRL